MYVNSGMQVASNKIKGEKNYCHGDKLNEAIP